MNELVICEHFHWSLDCVRNLDIRDYMVVVNYLKKANREQKKAMRKAKR